MLPWSSLHISFCIDFMQVGKELRSSLAPVKDEPAEAENAATPFARAKQ